MTTPNPSNDMLSAAEFTVSAAKKELGKVLDYSSDSLKDLDILIEHVKKHFLNLKKEGKLTDQTIQRVSVSIGGYLGEVIRRKHGGTWVAKNSAMKTLVINNEEFSPILYVFERLIKNSNYSLEEYWSKIDQAQIQEPITGANQTIPKNTGANLSSSNEISKNRNLVIGGIAAVVVLCVIGIISITVYSSIKANNEFKAKLNAFLVEANKLNLMTEQGVTYQEFRGQFFEVKSAYTLINYWPSSYHDEKQAFDKAIQGWELTISAWEVDLGDFSSIPDIDAFANDLFNYLGPENANIDMDKLVGVLMAQAGTYFEAGKAGVK